VIHLGRRSYPYAEEVNEGLVREFLRAPASSTGAPGDGSTGRVLDVGCGRGQLGEAVRALGWEVWGIESSGEACATAEKRLDRLICADLNDHAAVRAAVGDARFEALMLSDVLEHTYDPRTVLERYLEIVKPRGYLYVSVPNAVVWTNRLEWSLGRVKYQDTGVMDRTHIRFFTFASAKELVRASGCTIERVSSTPHLARAVLPAVKGLLHRESKAAHDPRAIIDSPAYRAYMKYVYPAERAFAATWPSLLAFRIIVVGRKPAD
jgi:2-polyprenyl-3-methyl-5-hydroxy-6-metoxy-1,4-benzoquinol methylase